MFKLFDYGPARGEVRKPNIDIMKTVHAENDINLHAEKGCNVYVLETPWFDGDHEPTTLEHVSLLCDQLQKLHEKVYVHGDVLRQNIIFGKDDEGNSVTELIDFDYSGAANIKKYPKTWNTEFEERHGGAKGGEQLMEVHDVYAAIVILCLYFQWREDEKEGRDIYKKFFLDGQKPSKENHPGLLVNYSARGVSNWITANRSKLEPKANPNLRSDTTSSKKHAYDGFVQTGSPPVLLRKKN